MSASINVISPSIPILGLHYFFLAWMKSEDQPMKSLSVCTQIANAYKAGLSLGNQLSDLAPDVIFLFSSIHYDQPIGLLNGLHEVLGSGVEIIGCSGDGFYSNAGASDIGASALAMNFEGKASAKMVVSAGLAENSMASSRRIVSAFEEGDEKPNIIFLLADFRADATEIEKVIEREMAVPVVGGLAGDDYQMQSCFLFGGDAVLTDSIVALGLYGDLDFEIHVGNNIAPVGGEGTITMAEGVEVAAIDGSPVMDFIQRETGKPALVSDKAVTSLMIVDSDDKSVKRLRSIRNADHASGENITLFGGVETGKKVRVCLADTDTLKKEVSDIVQTISACENAPQAALIFSCSGRKYFLGQEIQHEVSALTDGVSDQIQVSGFPTFGEIAPLRLTDGSYSRSLFHNMTYVLMLFR